MSTTFAPMTDIPLVDRIRTNLVDFPRRAADSAQRSAAVTICVLTGVPGRTEPRFLVIKRVPRGLNGGQWALPGGKVDAGESTVAAALRELHEEVGLAVDESSVVGLLDDFVTDSGFVITPVVVVVDGDPTLRRNPAEIHSIHPIPVQRLVAPGIPRWKRSDSGSLLQMPLRHDMVIHAPTGAILLQFREVALLGRSTRVHDLLQPEFTRI